MLGGRIEIYSQVIDGRPVSSTATAEMTKLLENIHRAENIGLVNELKIVADKMGIDIFEVITLPQANLSGSHRTILAPGWGHCINSWILFILPEGERVRSIHEIY